MSIKDVVSREKWTKLVRGRKHYMVVKHHVCNREQRFGARSGRRFTTKHCSGLRGPGERQYNAHENGSFTHFEDPDFGPPLSELGEIMRHKILDFHDITSIRSLPTQRQRAPKGSTT